MLGRRLNATHNDSTKFSPQSYKEGIMIFKLQKRKPGFRKFEYLANVESPVAKWQDLSDFQAVLLASIS